MNGIEKISARLVHDAQVEIDAINAETDAAVAQVMAEYEAKANELYTQRMAKGSKDVELRAQRLDAAADMESRKAILAFKQDMVSEAFAQAVDAMVSMPRERYVEFLASQAAAAAICGEGEVLFSEKDRPEVGAAIIKRANSLLKEKGIHGCLSLSDEFANIPGGFILRQGNIEVNCSVDTLVALYRSSLSSQVAEILFS